MKHHQPISSSKQVYRASEIDARQPFFKGSAEQLGGDKDPKKAPTFFSAVSRIQNPAIIQLVPNKRPDNDEYFDADYPELRLTKTGAPGRGNEYKIIGSETLIYYEPGEGWFKDYECNNRMDMFSFQGNPDARPGIENNGGKSYYYYSDVLKGGFMPVMQAYRLFQIRNQEAKHNDADLDQTKISRIVSNMEKNMPLHPIEVTLANGVFKLVQGRHRIVASMITGKKAVPYNVV